jgi:hypothetical protein
VDDAELLLYDNTRFPVAAKSDVTDRRRLTGPIGEQSPMRDTVSVQALKSDHTVSQIASCTSGSNENLVASPYLSKRKKLSHVITLQVYVDLKYHLTAFRFKEQTGCPPVGWPHTYFSSVHCSC